MTVIYELFVVETERERNVRQAIATRHSTPEYKQEVVFVGQSICGLRHGITRPNRIYVETTVNEKNLRWFAEVLLPCTAPDAEWEWQI